jgi:hypothetical protein
MKNMNKFIAWFFSRPPEPFSVGNIIGWWEIRRIPYNLIMYVSGIVSLIIFFIFINLAHELKPGEDAVEPLALIAALILLNICYTGGWIFELILSTFRNKNSSPIGPALLKLGLVFSIIIAFLPSASWFVIWIMRSIK